MIITARKRLAMGGFGGPGDPIDWAKITKLDMGLKPLSAISNIESPLSGDPAATSIPMGTRRPLSTTISARTSPTVTSTTAAGRTGGIFSSMDINKISSKMSDVAPFISNISNAMRKAPKPTLPILDTFNNLQKVNLSGERYDVSRNTMAANRAAERNVDANTAEAIKSFNNGQNFDRISQINERENNTNVGIGNQQAAMDQQVKTFNSEKMNDYFTARTASQIAQQREQSANIANAGDKIVMMDNEKRKAAVSQANTRILSSIFSKSGVLDRQRKQWKDAGIADPTGQDYKDLDTKAYGGMMRKVTGSKIR